METKYIISILLTLAVVCTGFVLYMIHESTKYKPDEDNDVYGDWPEVPGEDNDD
jgi:hypothetical protein